MDQTVRISTKPNKVHYPAAIRRIVAFIPELNRLFVFYTNVTAKQIVYLYRNRWQAVMRIFSSALLSKESLSDLLKPSDVEAPNKKNEQMEFD